MGSGADPPAQDLHGGAEAEDIRPPEFYVRHESVFEQLESPAIGQPPPVRLLDSDWLLRRADLVTAASTDAERAALALPCRQMLERSHPDAFLSAATLRSLPRNGTGALPAGAVSHAWITPDHPDPYGYQLVRLAATIRRAQEGGLPRQQEGWDTTHTTTKGYQKLAPRIGIFWDWGSLFQSKGTPEGRTAQQQASFAQALGSMQLWYVHQRLCAFLVTALPPNCTAPGYDERGWPTVERAWAMVAKPNAVSCWPMIYDVASADEASRAAPMHPDRLQAELETKRFTSPKADRPLVLKLYRETLLSILGGADSLDFNFLGWGAGGGQQLAEVLPLCARARNVWLMFNAIDDGGCAAIATALTQGALPSCERIAFAGNQIRDGGCESLARAIRGGALPSLQYLSFHRDGAENAAGEDARVELRAACSSRRAGIGCSA